MVYVQISCATYLLPILSQIRSKFSGFYHQKYPNKNEVIALRAITYFDDIDPNIDPPKMIKQINIEQIKVNKQINK